MQRSRIHYPRVAQPADQRHFSEENMAGIIHARASNRIPASDATPLHHLHPLTRSYNLGPTVCPLPHPDMLGVQVIEDIRSPHNIIAQDERPRGLISSSVVVRRARGEGQDACAVGALGDGVRERDADGEVDECILVTSLEWRCGLQMENRGR